MCFPDCYNEKFITALIKRSIHLGKNCQQMSKNLLYNQKIINRNVDFQSRQCLFLSSHFVDKKTRTTLSVSFVWSEWRDLNSRPYGPEPYALPNCATPRYLVAVNFDCLCNIHQFEHFCNKNKSIILKIMFYAIIFLSL